MSYNSALGFRLSLGYLIDIVLCLVEEVDWKTQRFELQVQPQVVKGALVNVFLYIQADLCMYVFEIIMYMKCLL